MSRPVQHARNQQVYGSNCHWSRVRWGRKGILKFFPCSLRTWKIERNGIDGSLEARSTYCHRKRDVWISATRTDLTHVVTNVMWWWSPNIICCYYSSWMNKGDRVIAYRPSRAQFGSFVRVYQSIAPRFTIMAGSWPRCCCGQCCTYTYHHLPPGICRTNHQQVISVSSAERPIGGASF